MKKITKISALLVVFGLIFSISFQGNLSQVAAQGVSAPVFDKVVSGSRPYITCTTSSSSEVMVYIDNTFAGMASVTSTTGSTSSFIYYYSSHLNSGKHFVSLASRDRKSLLVSDKSLTREIIIPGLQTPHLIEPTEKTLTSNQKIAIEGTSLSGTWVHVYVDGQYNGKTGILYDNSGNVRFAYKPFLNLDYGTHSAYAIAESKADGQSLVSNVITFRIEKPMPAPVIKTVYTSTGKLKVNGLSKSGSTVRIYVDRKLNGQIKTGQSKTGTSGFFYTSSKNITIGKHTIFATALDWRGKESPWSNQIVINQAKTYSTNPIITNQAVNEKNNTVAKIEEIKDWKFQDNDRDGINNYDELYKYKTNPNSKDTDGDGYDDKTEIDHGYSPLIKAEKKTEKPIAPVVEKVQPKVEVKPIETTTSKIESPVAPEANNSVELDASQTKALSDILGNISTSSQSSTTGSNAKKDNFVMNLVIFLVFLVGIIAWIFWVNKELIKEKTKANGENKVNKESEVKDDNDQIVI